MSRLKPQLLANMKFALNRRSFLKRSALAAGALSAGRLLPVPNLLAAPGPGGKLNCVQIGCGGRGMNHLDWLVDPKQGQPGGHRGRRTRRTTPR